jgi:rhodanese-related sulfurtransferase
MLTPPNRKSAHGLTKACLQALGIIVAATAFGLLFNALRPRGLELIRPGETAALPDVSGNHGGPQPIELPAAFEILKKGDALFIDARSEYDFKAGHIKTARNLPAQTLDTWMPDFFNTTPPETLLIIYCSNPRCHLAERLAARLYTFGYPHVRPMTAGWDGWLAAGYPTASDQ